MIIIIAKQNEKFIKEKMKDKSLNVVDQTENTLYVKLSRNRFAKLYVEIQKSGNTPYNLMAW